MVGAAHGRDGSDMTLPMEPVHRPRWPGALVMGALVVAVGGVAWYFTQPSHAPTVQAPTVSTRQPAASTAPTSVPAGAAPESRAVAGTAKAPAAGGDDLAALQFRLDAFAKAYNQGDVAALERALWQNHAVVRPSGETMYRTDLIGQWTREWNDIANRELGFVVEQLTREGATITAVWDLTLRGEVTDAKGEVHRMEINGSQKASYTITGQDWILEGPIVYVGFERTIDGDPWPLGQNGR